MALGLRMTFPRTTGAGSPSITQPKLPTENDGAPPRLTTSLLFVLTFRPALIPSCGRSITEPLIDTSIPDFFISPTFLRTLLRKPFDGTDRTLNRASVVVALNHVKSTVTRPSS